MNRKLQSTFDLVEQQRAELLVRLQPLTREELNWSPPGKWSILRIMSHLVTAERTALEYVRKKNLGVAEARDSGIPETIKMFLLVISQRMPMLKFKAPQLIEDRTIEYKDLTEAIKEWDAVRAEWNVFLDAIPDQYVRRKIFRHVVAGRLNIEQGVLFFREHIIHHKPQVEALIRRASQKY
jgi:uncharacterized damage-inducible protein DinB